ncbi:MAG TPA: polysaccharide biosynthesis/export family protein [Anaerohalosphaeraceae bacterium]|jgi:polysaccharide export outer membrane protein|nr:polysaccharide biosynthesis/export family protein [Anaerohalosphaeraceae bacterium]HRT51167.1 polysaccharide biosynthesis/export family protein [Anaerohalosphaeraceae bacterium]HRT87220.1 polysaccharide biosynthesis/export family protein [Anaerohalosphaeraceae bacterium]
MNLVAVFRCTLLVLFTIVLSGCFSANPEDVKAFLRPDQAQITGDDYILQPPDVVTILSSRVPELARSGSMSTVGMTQVIRPDGMITLESVGEIMVAGKTPRQVAEIIAQKLSELYKFTGDYPVDVRVTNQSKYYYILGQVQRPGAQIFTGRETTLSAIAKANPNVRAWEEAIQVIRPSLDLNERPKIFELDFKKMIEHGDMSKNVLLQEGDIIYVPPTILGSIGLTVEEIVGPLFQSATAARTLGVE